MRKKNGEKKEIYGGKTRSELKDDPPSLLFTQLGINKNGQRIKLKMRNKRNKSNVANRIKFIADKQGEATKTAKHSTKILTV